MMNIGRHGHTTSVLGNGTVLVTGGYANGAYVNSTELYDPLTGVWRVTGAMNTARAYHTASISGNGTVLVSGGKGNGSVYLNSAELYDPLTGVWRVMGVMNTAREYHTASVLKDGTVLVSGGYANGASLNSAELYYPGQVDGQWLILVVSCRCCPEVMSLK